MPEWIDIDQRKEPDVWLRHRLGCPTSSRLCDLMAKLAPVGPKDNKKPNPKEAAPRMKYMKEKVFEWLTGLSAEHHTTSYMDDGIQNEDFAIAAYERITGSEVLHGGIFVHDIGKFMASPDGRVGDNGLVECKYLTGNTTEANHIDLLQGAEVPDDYVLQMQGQLACSGRQWCDFVSHNPDIKHPKLKTFIKRFERDEKIISAIEFEVLAFLAELVKRLQGLGVTASMPEFDEAAHIVEKLALSVADAKGIIP